MKHILGAYAASPTATSWNPKAEAAYLAEVAELPGLRGLEVPFTGILHHDEGWLFDHLDPTWDLVLTAIPGTVARNAADPKFGLASPDRDGRLAAVEFTAALHAALLRCDDHCGGPAVIAVELHSAPTAIGTADALAASMEEIGGWDWHGAALTIEHCDATRPDLPPQKGYLSLADELSVVAANPAVAGVTVNWGRSAIEDRSAATPLTHIRDAVAAGALTGLMFSGVADRPGTFGQPWVDAHLPPSTVEPTSLLGPAEIGQTLAAAGGRQSFTGVKIGVRPMDLPLDRRIAQLREAISTIDRIDSTAADGTPARG